MKTLKYFLRACLPVAAIFGVLLVSTSASAAVTGVSLTDVSTNIQGTVSSIANILNAIALLAGIGFVMASFFKFHQHKLNPTQVPLSQGITLLLIGAGLTLFPVIIPSAKDAVVGTKAQVSSVTGGDMKKLIGGK